MTSQGAPAPPAGPDRQRARRAEVALRSMGQPNAVVREFDFWDDSYEGRRLFSEVLGTFFLVLVVVGGGMVNARFGGTAVPYTARVVAPALIAVGIAWILRGPGGGRSGTQAAEGTLASRWRPGRIGRPEPAPDQPPRPPDGA